MNKLAFGLSLALLVSACGHAAFVAAPLAAAMTPSVDAVQIIAGPPGAEMAAAEAQVVRGPWSAERLALARSDDRWDGFSAFAPVLGESFTATNYPLTKAVFDRALAPLGASTSIAKERYDRPRPFEADASVTPCSENVARLRGNGSYPSGHAAFGWAWALVLAELDPDRADAILTRGREYGDSRVVCGVHYPSDVEAGRVLAAAAVARLHAEPGFRAALAAARAEFAR
jgi:acid phosphatase (class A)